MKTPFVLAGGIAALTALTGVHAAPGRAMTINDLITTVRVSEPHLSPDGRWVAYVRTTTNPQTGKRNPDIWVVPADGSAAPQTMLGGDASELTPTFSPDTKRLAFISNHDGPPQVFIASTTGTGIRPITKLALGVTTPLLFSSDGMRVAYVSDVYPECTGDPSAEAFAKAEACNARRAEEAEKNPVKAHHVKRLLYKHWSDWRDELRHHVFVTEVESGRTVDVTPGDFDAPPFFYEDGAVAFSPDGKHIAFVSNREGNDAEAWTTNQDVWIVPVTGGAAKRLTSNKAADVQPRWTADGQKIVMRSQRRPAFESDRWYLDVVDVGSGARQTVFEAPDLSVENFRLAPDGRSILFTAQDKGVVNVYLVPYPSGAPRVVARGGAIVALDAGRDFAIISKSTMTAPADLFRVGTSDGAIKQLTRENESWLKDVALNQPENLTVPGAGGASVQYWLIKPPNFDPSKKYPTVVLIHGGPQGAWEDAWSFRWNPELWAAQGWVIAAPNPRGSTGFGQKFVDEISQDWGGKVMVDLNAVFDTVAKQAYVDPQRLGVAGASYGGYAVNWIIGHTNRFKAAVTHDGVYNLDSMMTATEELWFPEWEMGGVPWSATARENVAKWSPHRFAANMKTPTFIITNELDFRVPVDQGMQLFTALRRQGVPSEMLIFPDEGHWVLKALNSKHWHEQVFRWMKRWIEQ